jgi:hypothetical protein
MTGRLFSFLLLAAMSAGVWANPCATGGRPFPGDGGTGMGGTGLKSGQSDGSGMGGTGHRDGSGAGGTGQQVRTEGDGSGTGGTGVVGIITGFGSICVNELEIHYDAKTPVTVDGQSSRADQLAVGQLVAVRAEGKGVNLRASQIQVRHALVGRVETVNQDGRLKVWGQWVSPPLMSRVQPGERVKVSGYRTDAKHVLASRIDPAKVGDPDVLTGEVEWSQSGEALVNGVRIRLPGAGERLKPGQEIRVSGRPDAGGFKAEKIELDGLRGFMDKLDRISVKDKIRPSAQPGKLKVGGMEFSLDANASIKGGNARELRPGQLVKVEARQQGGRAIIERIEIRDDGGARNHEKSDGAAIRSKPRDDAKEKRDTGNTSERGDDEDHWQQETRRVNAERGERREYEKEDGHAEKAEKIEQPEKIEKPEKAEKVEIERVEKPEKSEKVEIERVEKPEKIEKPEKMEKPEKPEKVEKPEKIEIERPERPEHDD